MSVSSVGRQSGISVIELIVVLAVASLLLSLVATMFATSLTAQRQTSDREAATAGLNAVTASITESVRGSVDVRVSTSGQRLDATVLLSDGTSWECRAWQLTDGELRYSSGASARAAADSTWASIASGVSGTFTGGAVFVESGSRIALGMRITRGDASVAVSDGSNSLAVATGGPACW
jgi:type II secretory pathway pseudopilin PulG